MAWVKKNLVLLIVAVVSLAALAYAIVFVRKQMAENVAVTENLDASAERFKNLLNRSVHPGNEKVDNIGAAKEQVVQIKNFAEEMKEYLKGPEIATNMGNREFRALLDTSLTELRREAMEAGVSLPNTNWWFTFSSYKSTVDFKGDVPGLTSQLEEIKNLMHILYDARVYSIATFKRQPISDTDNTGTSDFIGDGRQPKTNDWAVLSTYQITFHGFSSELARVMEGLANAKNCYVVKSLGVAQAPEEKKATAPMMAMPTMPMPGMGMGDGMERYRYMQRPMMPQVQAIRPAAPAGPQQKTILDQQTLRFTVTLDSIRLKSRGRG